MALTHRFYRSARIGAGVRGDGFRSALTRYITAQGQNDFEDWILDPVDVGLARYSLAICDSTVHAQAAADADIKAISPELAAAADATSWLNGALSVDSAVQTAIEGDRIPIDNVTTNRDLMDRVSGHHRLGNFLAGSRDTDALDIMRATLTSTVADLPARVRNRIQAWMVEHGVDTTGITGTSTIRAVLKRIIQSGAVGRNQFSRLRNA